MTKEELEVLQNINKKLEKLDIDLQEVKQDLAPVKQKTERIGNIEKRIEEIRIDTNRTKGDVLFLKLNAKTLGDTVEIIKLDGEKVREKVEKIDKDMQIVKKEVRGHTALLEHLYKDTVSQGEHAELKERVKALESL